MKRRHVLSLFSSLTGAALLSAHAPGWAQASSQRASSVADRILILVELKGGNDGLNTVVPFADPLYAQLRPVIGLKPDELIRLDGKTGLHPELKAAMPLWEQGQLGIVQGVGYPQPNLSHFRSIEIWETGSKSAEYLPDGWATRGLNAGLAAQGQFTTEGVMIGSSEFGALAGARAVSLNNPEAFVNQSRFVRGMDSAPQGNAALKQDWSEF